MSSIKTGYARYTFAFASDVQKLADDKHIKVLSFSTNRRRNAKGSYDVLEVRFVIPRPDRNEVETPEKPLGLETAISELEVELEKDNEVITNDI